MVSLRMGIIFRQFLLEGGCNSFIIGDEVTRKAAIIDPRADQLALYDQVLKARGLAVTVVVDTHTHADHYSGSHLVAATYGARIAMSDATKSARAAIRLSDRQPLEIGGELALETVATPGHTPDSLTLLLRAPGFEAAFTGDTLFIGGSGRTDFPGSDAGQQYDSIHGRLGALGERTWVFPGHDYSGLLFSTIGHEKKTNPHWLLASRDEFVRFKQAEALESGGCIPAVLSFNLSANPRNAPRAGVVTMCATVCSAGPSLVERVDSARWEELLSAARAAASGRGSGPRLIDVREPEEFAKLRIEGVENIPLSEVVLHWPELKAAPAVYFMCDRGPRSLVAAETARRLGLGTVGDLTGGILAWVASGRHVRHD